MTKKKKPCSLRRVGISNKKNIVSSPAHETILEVIQTKGS